MLFPGGITLPTWHEVIAQGVTSIVAGTRSALLSLSPLLLPGVELTSSCRHCYPSWPVAVLNSRSSFDSLVIPVLSGIALIRVQLTSCRGINTTNDPLTINGLKWAVQGREEIECQVDTKAARIGRCSPFNISG